MHIYLYVCMYIGMYGTFTRIPMLIYRKTKSITRKYTDMAWPSKLVPHVPNSFQWERTHTYTRTQYDWKCIMYEYTYIHTYFIKTTQKQSKLTHFYFRKDAETAQLINYSIKCLPFLNGRCLNILRIFLLHVIFHFHFYLDLISSLHIILWLFV